MRRKNAETQGTKERFNHRKWLLRQSWCRAIQTYEDTLSFGGVTKLSNYVVWLSTIKFLHLKMTSKVTSVTGLGFPSSKPQPHFSRVTRSEDIQIPKESNLDWANWTKANSLGGYRLRIHGMRWKCHTSEWINATAMVPFLQPLDCCALAADPKQRSIHFSFR